MVPQIVCSSVFKASLFDYVVEAGQLASPDSGLALHTFRKSLISLQLCTASLA